MSELSPTKYVSELVPGRETSLVFRVSTPEPPSIGSNTAQKLLEDFESAVNQDIEENDSGLFSSNNTPEKEFDSMPETIVESVEQHQQKQQQSQLKATNSAKSSEQSLNRNNKKDSTKPKIGISGDSNASEAELKTAYTHPTCPLPGCNSLGHTKGDYRHHRRVASCPNMKQVQAKFAEQLKYGNADPNDFFENINPSELYNQISGFVKGLLFGSDNGSSVRSSSNSRSDKKASKKVVSSNSSDAVTNNGPASSFTSGEGRLFIGDNVVSPICESSDSERFLLSPTPSNISDQSPMSPNGEPVHNTRQASRKSGADMAEVTCPTPNCDGSGHILGYKRHRTAANCPIAAEMKIPRINADKVSSSAPSTPSVPSTIVLSSQKCQTPNCDGTGNTKSRHSHHNTMTHCPMAMRIFHEKHLPKSIVEDIIAGRKPFPSDMPKKKGRPRKYNLPAADGELNRSKVHSVPNKDAPAVTPFKRPLSPVKTRSKKIVPESKLTDNKSMESISNEKIERRGRKRKISMENTDIDNESTCSSSSSRSSKRRHTSLGKAEESEKTILAVKTENILETGKKLTGAVTDEGKSFSTRRNSKMNFNPKSLTDDAQNGPNHVVVLETQQKTNKTSKHSLNGPVVVENNYDENVDKKSSKNKTTIEDNVADNLSPIVNGSLSVEKKKKKKLKKQQQQQKEQLNETLHNGSQDKMSLIKVDSEVSMINSAVLSPVQQTSLKLKQIKADIPPLKKTKRNKQSLSKSVKEETDETVESETSMETTSDSILTRSTRSGEKIFSNVTSSTTNIPTVIKRQSFKSKKARNSSSNSEPVMQSLLSGNFVYKNGPTKAVSAPASEAAPKLIPPSLIAHNHVHQQSSKTKGISIISQGSVGEEKPAKPAMESTKVSNVHSMDYLLSHNADVQSFPALVLPSFPHWISCEAIQNRHSTDTITDAEFDDWKPTETLRLVASPIFTGNMKELFSAQKEQLTAQLKRLDDELKLLQDENLSLSFAS